MGGGPLSLAGGLTFHARPGELLQGNLVLHTAPDKDLKINSKGIELYFRGFEHTTITVQTNGGGKHHHRHHHTTHGGGDLFNFVAPTVQSGPSEHVFPRGSIIRFPFAFQCPPCPFSTSVAIDYFGTSPEDDAYACRCEENGYKHRATAEVRYEVSAGDARESERRRDHEAER